MIKTNEILGVDARMKILGEPFNPFFLVLPYNYYNGVRFDQGLILTFASNYICKCIRLDFNMLVSVFRALLITNPEAYKR